MQREDGDLDGEGDEEGEEASQRAAEFGEMLWRGGELRRGSGMSKVPVLT